MPGCASARHSPARDRPCSGAPQPRASQLGGTQVPVIAPHPGGSWKDGKGVQELGYWSMVPKPGAT